MPKHPSNNVIHTASNCLCNPMPNHIVLSNGPYYRLLGPKVKKGIRRRILVNIEENPILIDVTRDEIPTHSAHFDPLSGFELKTTMIFQSVDTQIFSIGRYSIFFYFGREWYYFQDSNLRLFLYCYICRMITNAG